MQQQKRQRKINIETENDEVDEEVHYNQLMQS